jgi:hypothetical protein
VLDGVGAAVVEELGVCGEKAAAVMGSRFWARARVFCC